jgi:PAS domain S-box-containing protein
MSTSYVGRKVMGRVHERFKDFRYRRTALNPINPQSRAREKEAEMIARFNADPALREWSGLIQREGQAYYARFRAITADASCLHCHGDPADTPKDIIAIYGQRADPAPYVTGSVVGTDAVYIPVAGTFNRIKRHAWVAFVTGAGLLLTLTLLFYTLFNYTVVAKLTGLLKVFNNIIPRPQHPVVPAPVSQDEIGQIKHALLEVADDLRRTHEDLAASEAKFRILFETSRDPVFFADRDLKLSDINAAGLELFQFESKAEAHGIATVEQLFWDARDCGRLIKSLDADGSVKDYEVSMVNRHGDRLDIMVTANLRLSEEGAPTGYEGFLRDVTACKRLENQLAHTDKFASLGQLATGVAHEINNPLGVIKCYANLIAKGTEGNAQIQADVATIQKHTTTCRQIVEGLLNFARDGEAVVAPVNVNIGLEKVLTLLEPQWVNSGIEVVRHYCEPLPAVHLDAGKMKQVYMNLLLNAAQSMPAGGRITVTTAMAADRSAALICIGDTGCGIAEKQLDAIFDPFYTTKKIAEGTGLGLSISYGIVREHGGRLIVASRLGEGSNFTIHLPFAPEKESVQ